MTQPNLLGLARQGNIDAIASVINYALQDKGITVKVFSQGNYLEIIAETNSIPEQKKVVAYIRKIITQVKINKFNKIKVSGKRSNTNTISWNKSITLDCKEVNFSKNEQQNQSKISTHQQWPFWFPYPSSWLRALVLILIAFPGASLICLGFGGMLLSTITNSLKIFIFFAVFGLLLPTLIFSGLYYLLWFKWKKSLSTQWLKWSKSLWEGFYATLVMGISFLLILTIIALLVFSACDLSYEISEQAARCAGRGLGQAARAIFAQTIYIWDTEGRGIITRYHDHLIVKFWSIIWLVIASYLYQIEYLIRDCLFKFILTFKKIKNK